MVWRNAPCGGKFAGFRFGYKTKQSGGEAQVGDPGELTLLLLERERNFQMWSQLCFPEWKQKPQKRKVELEEGQEEAEVECHQPEEKKRREEEEVEEEQQQQLEVGTSSAAAAMAVQQEGGEQQQEVPEEAEGFGANDRLCHLCMFVCCSFDWEMRIFPFSREESRYPGRHIAQRWTYSKY
jgi:hypothetical protein